MSARRERSGNGCSFKTALPGSLPLSTVVICMKSVNAWSNDLRPAPDVLQPARRHSLIAFVVVAAFCLQLQVVDSMLSLDTNTCRISCRLDGRLPDVPILDFRRFREKGNLPPMACLAASKICNKSGVSLGNCPHKRLGVAGAPYVPRVADLVTQCATSGHAQLEQGRNGLQHQYKNQSAVPPVKGEHEFSLDQGIPKAPAVPGKLPFSRTQCMVSLCLTPVWDRDST